MRLISVNISQIRTVTYRDRTYHTGIFKQPVSGLVTLRSLGLDGDVQGDKKHHGGIHMAAYGYTAENYDYWRKESGRSDLPYGKFGENFTTEGINEDEVCIGDRFRIGKAEVEVSMPRAPCSTFGMAMDDPGFPKVFLASGKVGFYLRVLREGTVKAGDLIERVFSHPARLSIRGVTHLYYFEKDNREGARRAAAVEPLGPIWKEELQKRAGG